MSEEKTFYNRLIDRWQNNKFLAYTVILIGTLGSGIAMYDRFVKFTAGLTDKTVDISAFNETVQPIYFIARDVEPVPGQEDYLVEIADKIIEIQPAAVILRSHTSRITPEYNVPISRQRGTRVADFLIHRLGCDYEGEVIVVPRGGADTSGQDAGYEQRVDIELTDDVSSVVGLRVRRNPTLC